MNILSDNWKILYFADTFGNKCVKNFYLETKSITGKIIVFASNVDTYTVPKIYVRDESKKIILNISLSDIVKEEYGQIINSNIIYGRDEQMKKGLIFLHIVHDVLLSQLLKENGVVVAQKINSIMKVPGSLLFKREYKKEKEKFLKEMLELLSKTVLVNNVIEKIVDYLM